MNEEKDILENGTEAERLYGEAYRQGEGHCAPTNPENRFDEAPASVKLSIPEAEPSVVIEGTGIQPPRAAPADDGPIKVFDIPVADIIMTMLPKDAPEGSRHKMALRLASDLIILFDGDLDKVRKVLLSLKWVKDVVKERGQDEIERILKTAQKRMEKREAENYGDPQPSKEMRDAIKLVTGRSYKQLSREARLTAEGHQLAEAEYDIQKMLESMGCDVEKLFPHFPVIRLLCHLLKRRHYIAALLVGGAFFMTLMTRCWYRFWSAPGRQCRLNSLVALIGRMGSGKHIAVDLYKILMEPVKMADKAQVDALNNWNAEREQKSGSSKNKAPRPQGIYRCLPPETSAAAIREAETNAHEEVDGKDIYLHCSIFDSELDNTLRQLKKGYMEQLFTLWLKCFHNEPHGSFLKTSSAHVGEYPIHFNAVYTGTEDALKKLATESNYVNGLLSRFTVIPMGDSNFEMMEAHKYDDKDRERDDALRQWAYKLDATKGEIPCEDISTALYKWTERRMAEAKENTSPTLEDILKRPCWHGINFALPFILSRHWDQMVQDEDGRWKCPANFKTDKTDIRLALLIAQAQLAFQEHFFMSIGEKYYDDREAERVSRGQHQKKTLLAYRRLPNPCTSVDIDREYGYNGVVGSICSCLKRLQDDGLLQKIRSGEDKGKYRKLA